MVVVVMLWQNHWLRLVQRMRLLPQLMSQPLLLLLLVLAHRLLLQRLLLSVVE